MCVLTHAHVTELWDKHPLWSFNICSPVIKLWKGWIFRSICRLVVFHFVVEICQPLFQTEEINFLFNIKWELVPIKIKSFFWKRKIPNCLAGAEIQSGFNQATDTSILVNCFSWWPLYYFLLQCNAIQLQLQKGLIVPYWKDVKHLIQGKNVNLPNNYPISCSDPKYSTRRGTTFTVCYRECSVACCHVYRIQIMLSNSQA